MAFRQKKKKAAACKPNVIPILDAVFIFIFFLLMSAQFLEIYEIGSDAPAVKTVSQDNKDKKPPLNLTLEVAPSSITVKTGLDGNVVKTVGLKDGNYDFGDLAAALVNLKKKHVGETSVVIKPDSKVEYKKLVFIMDTCREVPNGQPTIVAKNDKGETVETRDLFNQIIFETII
jgi:biopolymer transport protein ExbD